MRKQIFVDLTLIGKLNLLGVTTSDLHEELSVCHILWLGLINHLLDDRANCKKIINIEFDVNIDDIQGYLITYLESEMIASKDDLENAFMEGTCKTMFLEFEQWFKNYF